MTTASSVVIIGLGWVGSALAESLLKQGYSVSGSTRSGTHPLQAQWPSLDVRALQVEQGRLQTSSVNEQHPWPTGSDWVITLPPNSRQGRSDYPDNIQAIVALALQYQPRSLLMLSSTAVYQEFTGQEVMNESSPLAQSARAQLLLAGERALENKTVPYRVLRLGGLFGLGRHPGRFTAGKELSSGANDPVNMAYLPDVVAAICCCLAQPEHGKRHYNVVSPNHPSKQQFYGQACSKLGLASPTFTGEQTSQRMVSGQALSEDFDFAYLAQNLFDCLDLGD